MFLTYKANDDDDRESSTKQILELLQESEVLIDDCGSDFSAT